MLTILTANNGPRRNRVVNGMNGEDRWDVQLVANARSWYEMRLCCANGSRPDQPF